MPSRSKSTKPARTVGTSSNNPDAKLQDQGEDAALALAAKQAKLAEEAAAAAQRELNALTAKAEALKKAAIEAQEQAVAAEKEEAERRKKREADELAARKKREEEEVQKRKEAEERRKREEKEAAERAKLEEARLKKEQEEQRRLYLAERFRSSKTLIIVQAWWRGILARRCNRLKTAVCERREKYLQQSETRRIESTANLQSNPVLRSTATVLFPSDAARRLTVGDQVKLAPHFKADLGPEADGSGLLEQGEVGEIIKDDTHDEQDKTPYQVRKPNGETYWYGIADLVAADPGKLQRPNKAVVYVSAEKQPKEALASGKTVMLSDDQQAVMDRCKQIGIWNNESAAFVGKLGRIVSHTNHRQTECFKLECQPFGEQWFPKSVLLVPTTAKPEEEASEVQSELTPAQYRALQLLSVLQFIMKDAVGMGKTLSVCQAIVDDCWGRSLTEHQHYSRHMIIKGNLGSGKRTAANMVARTLNLVGAVHSDLMHDYEKFGGGQVPIEGGKLQELLCVQYGEIECRAAAHSVLTPAKRRTVVHFRIGEEIQPKMLAALSALLDKMSSEGDVAILSGSHEHIEKLETGLSAFRKRAPISLELPDLTAEQLAAVSLQLIRQHGYRLDNDPSRPVPPTVQTDLDLMTFIVTQTYSTEQIRSANYYLAAELLERAVSNKNKRERSKRSNGKFQGALLGLTVSDFGVEMLTREEMLRRQAAVDEEIAEMIGYDKAKAFIAELKGKVESVKDGGDRKKLESCLNCVVTGNPGTGKTTFARLFFKFLRAYGVLQKDVFVEINGLDLKGQYVGSTAPKVQGFFKQAMGGCLFIDEAYAVNDREGGQGGDSFSSEATRTLLTEVENNRTSVLVVLAGYREKMGRMMRADPGLARRFPGQLHLDDYTPSEIAEIACRYAKMHFSMKFAEDVLEKLAVHVEEQHSAEIAKQNGGLAINLVEKAVNAQSTRLVQLKQLDQRGDEHELIAEDFGIYEKPQEQSRVEKETVDAEIRGMIGMSSAKELFDDVRRKVEYVQQGGNKKLLKVCLNMVITGNPGTGKTTLARLMGKFLHAYGVLPKDVFVERNGLEMKGQYVGHTMPLVKEAVEDAMGGCLFLDEAYALAGDTETLSRDSFATEAIRSLLTLVENNRTNMLIVLAGYKDKMGALMRADDGLPRRFPKRIHLGDYAPQELALIAEKVAVERFGVRFEEGLSAQLAKLIAEKYPTEVSKLNGGLSVNLVEAATARLADRCMEEGIFDGEMAETLTAADFGVDEQTTDAKKRAAVDAEVEALVGMDEAKLLFAKVRKIAKFVENGGNKAVLRRCLNMVITGNPGTGKTTLARLMGKFLHAYGVLSKDTFTERNALQLKGRYVGHTAPMVRESVQESMGGCLFIDEAYALTGGAGLGDSYGADAVRMLLTEVENARSHCLVILAGYKQPMAGFMAADSGLQRRFPVSIDLPDYTPAELAAIAKHSAERQGLYFAPQLLEALQCHIEEKHQHQIQQLNGGLAVNLTEAAIGEMAVRCADANIMDVAATSTLRKADFGISNACENTYVSIMNITRSSKADDWSVPSAKLRPAASDEQRQSWSTVRALKMQQGIKTPPAMIPPTASPLQKEMDLDEWWSGAGDDGFTDLYDHTPSSNRATPPMSQEGTMNEPPQEMFQTQERSKEQIDVEDDEEILRKLDESGMCKQGFAWQRCAQPTQPCGHCNLKFVKGFRCAGHSHFICEMCRMKHYQ